MMIRAGKVLFMIVPLLLLPVSVSPRGGLEIQTACAGEEDGSGCCFHPMGICDVGGQPQHAYENKSWVQIVFGCGD